MAGTDRTGSADANKEIINLKIRFDSELASVAQEKAVHEEDVPVALVTPPFDPILAPSDVRIETNSISEHAPSNSVLAGHL